MILCETCLYAKRAGKTKTCGYARVVRHAKTPGYPTDKCIYYTHVSVLLPDIDRSLSGWEKK